jgi:c(7)-type cytochrome triheme protein
MNFTGLLPVLAALLLLAGNATAVPSGRTVEFASPRGKVTFDGKAHAGKGVKCADCHSMPKLFEMKKGGARMTMAAMNEGKFCGACHDGRKAFSANAVASCMKCHQTNTSKEESPGDISTAPSLLPR